MSRQLRCPQGHTWETSGDAPANCPVCGQTAVRPPDGETVAYEPQQQRPDDLTHGAEGRAPEEATLTGKEEPAIAALPGSPRVAGFEILRELGRGGMGVVYLARQTKLNRLVALKMILAGSHAAAADLQRFRAEAESIAQLRHPNIVQIYSVGEHGSRPFFVLEYVDGGSLAQRLSGRPLPPKDAAQLVELAARDIHAAHQHGIIHRDLKPANVLLASGGRKPPVAGEATGGLRSPLEACIPKIADFGLAKKLDTDRGKTRTGAILGTPSYMPPEQASGKKDLGPTVDVYALGAILYECLTGRPPFKAETPLDTVLDVIAGQVGFRIGLDVLRHELAAVAQLDQHLVGPFDDVIVRHDHALGINEEAGTEAVLPRRFGRLARLILEVLEELAQLFGHLIAGETGCGEFLEELVQFLRLLPGLGRFGVDGRLEASFDADDGGQDVLDDLAVGGDFTGDGGRRLDLSGEEGAAENGAGQDAGRETKTDKAGFSHGVGSFQATTRRMPARGISGDDKAEVANSVWKRAVPRLARNR